MVVTSAGDNLRAGRSFLLVLTEAAATMMHRIRAKVDFLDVAKRKVINLNDAHCYGTSAKSEESRHDGGREQGGGAEGERRQLQEDAHSRSIGKYQFQQLFIMILVFL